MTAPWCLGGVTLLVCSPSRPRRWWRVQQLRKDKQEKGYAGIIKFLNRLLAVPVAEQSRIFPFFHSMLVRATTPDQSPMQCPLLLVN